MPQDENTNPLAVHPRWLSAAETAKILRQALKKAFPAVKFSVTSHTYAGGASIDVKWTDGPLTEAVDAVCNGFKGGGFDGSIDMAYNSDSWLHPDGTASLAYTPGTERSGGSHRAVLTDPPVPGCELVSFGANFVFTTRKVSRAAYWAFLFDVERERRLAVRHERWNGECSMSRGIYGAIQRGEAIATSDFRDGYWEDRSIYRAGEEPPMEEYERAERIAHGWTPPTAPDPFADDLAEMVRLVEAA